MAKTGSGSAFSARRWSLIREASLSPLVLDIAAWLTHEVTTEHPMEVSSIASYFSKLKDGLIELDQEISFEDLDPDDWLEFRELIETGHDGEQLKQRQSILRRFSAYWRKPGDVQYPGQSLPPRMAPQPRSRTHPPSTYRGAMSSVSRLS